MAVTIDGTSGITTPSVTNSGASTATNLTTTGNTILGDASTDTLNVGNGGLVKDASGNVGIGVVPSAWSLIKALELSSGVYLGSYTASSTPNLYLGANNYFNGTNFIYSGSYAATRYEQTAGVHSWFNAASGTAGNAVTFSERMRIDSSGNLLVGTTSGAQHVFVKSNASGYATSVVNTSGTSPYGLQINLSGVTGGAGAGFLVCQDNGNRFIIGGTGAVYSAALGTGTVYSNGGSLTNTNPSDERLKDNIANLSWGLQDILQLRPVSYTWKNNPTNQGTQYGFIAQEVQSVMPELVREFETKEGDETVTRYGLEKDGIYAALVKAIQEQQALITELNTIVTRQQDDITALQADIAALKGN
jgi:hypothetical protein